MTDSDVGIHSSFELVDGFGTVVGFSGLGKFLQERKRITIRNQNR